MKKVLTKFIALSSIGLLMLSACKKDGALVTSNGGKAGTLNASTTTPALDKAKLTDTTKIINFSFTTANYGFSAAVTNTLQIDAVGDNWLKPTSVTFGNKVHNQGYSTADFNALLLKLNLPAGVASQIQVRVAHSISADVAPVYSNVISMTVTPFNLTSFLWITGSFSGWGNPGTPPTIDSLVSVTGNGVYVGVINFTTGNRDFLILPVKGDWSHKYATNDAKNSTSSTVTYDAPNNLYAPSSVGWYQVTFNLNSGSISFAPVDNYSVIGNAAQGWGTDVDMKYLNDGSSGMWVVTTPLSVELPPNDGYKIRKNHDWGTSYGTSNSDGKSLTSSSGVNVGNAVAGTYKITFWLNPADNTGVTAFYTAVKQ